MGLLLLLLRYQASHCDRVQLPDSVQISSLHFWFLVFPTPGPSMSLFLESFVGVAYFRDLASSGCFTSPVVMEDLSG